MDTNLTENVNTATEKKEQPKTSAPVVAKVAEKPKSIYDNDSRYAAYKIVRLRLLKAGTIQYDPNNPELILNTAAPEGMYLPLTPFFAARINQTLELIL